MRTRIQQKKENKHWQEDDLREFLRFAKKRVHDLGHVLNDDQGVLVLSVRLRFVEDDDVGRALIENTAQFLVENHLRELLLHDILEESADSRSRVNVRVLEVS